MTKKIIDTRMMRGLTLGKGFNLGLIVTVNDNMIILEGGSPKYKQNPYYEHFLPEEIITIKIRVK